MSESKATPSFPVAGKTVYRVCLYTALILVLFGFIVETPTNIFWGLVKFVQTPDILTTDYFVVGGIGAAMVNAGIVMLISIWLLWKCKTPFTGNAISRAFLMAGFALFGKNPVNILPFFLGAYLYCRIRKLPMAKYTGAALYSSALAPIVSDVMIRTPFPFWFRLILAVAVGALISYLLIPVAEHSFSAHMGYTLFNYGFAGGLLALVFASVVKALGFSIDMVYIWQTGVDTRVLILLLSSCIALILGGLYLSNWSFKPFYRIMRHSGRAPTDFVITDGVEACLVNMGVVGVICIAYILMIGGDLNGPVVGAIITAIGFASCGLHPRNIIPIMVGVFLASNLMTHTAATPSLQLAALFGTALAPIAGQFGWGYGIVAGMLHSALVLAIAAPCGGYNLYNNGFAAGLIALVMVGFIQGFSRKWHHEVEV